jgi:hypothetical protein
MKSTPKPINEKKIDVHVFIVNIIYILLIKSLPLGSTRQHSWLRHYATSRKVAGSIPDEVIEFLN